MNDELIASLSRAVQAAPTDQHLRVLLAEQLVAAGRGAEAVPHAATILQQDPTHARARELMTEALGGTAPAPAARPSESPAAENPAAESPAAESPAQPVDPPDSPASRGDFDWSRAEEDLGEVVSPMFAESTATASELPDFDVEGARITLADVGGMVDVKKRLNAAFLAPMRNEKLRAMYRKSLRGGMLLYGPPGTGKTFIARALAGELDAKFLSVGIAEVLDSYYGGSERNIHELFEVARANAPVVLFLDEIDALGRKRSTTTSDFHRNTVNQLLLELDSVSGNNDGVFTLAATNTPWDVDPALRRPGRFDRTVLVLPPDQEAREAIWRTHLRERPIAGIDLKRLAKLSDGFTGADIAHACEGATEIALMDAAEAGELRMIQQSDLEAALGEIRPSVGPWFEAARNVALFANEDGAYDDLLKYLRKRKMI